MLCSSCTCPCRACVDVQCHHPCSTVHVHRPCHVASPLYLFVYARAPLLLILSFPLSPPLLDLFFSSVWHTMAKLELHHCCSSPSSGRPRAYHLHLPIPAAASRHLRAHPRVQSRQSASRARPRPSLLLTAMAGLPWPSSAEPPP